jgi:hypothetical protein
MLKWRKRRDLIGGPFWIKFIPQHAELSVYPWDGGNIYQPQVLFFSTAGTMFGPLFSEVASAKRWCEDTANTYS